LKISSQPSAFSNQPKQRLATLCRPDSKNRKRRLKLTWIGSLKNVEKGHRQPFDRPFELGFDLYFQQKAMGGGVSG
jgi:hypothetical protein